VKSLLGEDLPAIELDGTGVRGDRLWALRTSAGRIGAGKRTPHYVRLPHLLEMSARGSRPSRWSTTCPSATDRVTSARTVEDYERTLRRVLDRWSAG
jgi:uncharacterized protein YcbX